MKVIAIQKGTFNMTQYDNVSNIALSGANVIITYGSSQSQTLVYADYMLQIIP